MRLHESSDEFRALAEPVYRRDPVVHTIELTVLRSGRLPADSLLLTVWNGSRVIGAALQTPPHSLLCNAIPRDAVDVVAAELARVRPELIGVRGTRDTAVAFASEWHAVTGRTGRVSGEERLYRLAALQSPSGVAGLARAADDDDRQMLMGWIELFFSEAFGHQREAGEFVDAANGNGDQFILWAVDAVPVSLAMLRAPADGVSRIGPVFTPAHSRGHGYGSAVTAAAAADLALRRGAGVVLFTDAANPTSNAIYQRIGFEPVDDIVRITFAPVE